MSNVRYLFNRNNMYSFSSYTTYEYEDDSAPHSSHDYYESSDYPGKRYSFFIYLFDYNINNLEIFFILLYLQFYFDNTFLNECFLIICDSLLYLCRVYYNILILL